MPYSNPRFAYASLQVGASNDEGKTLKEAEKEEEKEEEEEKDKDLGEQSSDTIQTEGGNSATIDKSQIDPDNTDSGNNNNQNNNNNNNEPPVSPNTGSSSNTVQNH